jgi:hypothetical protein
MHKPCPDHCAASVFAPISTDSRGRPHRWSRYAQGMVGSKISIPRSKATILHHAKKNRDRKHEDQLAQVMAECSRDPGDRRGPTRPESWMGRRGNSGDQAKSPLRHKYLSPSAYFSVFDPCRMRRRHRSVSRQSAPATHANDHRDLSEHCRGWRCGIHTYDQWDEFRRIVDG